LPGSDGCHREAKLSVLLTAIMTGTWLECDDNADYDVRLARQLLLEFAGVAAAAWKGRFTEPPPTDVEAA
jgi:hypothetical protein